jgi:hypothetical protein
MLSLYRINSSDANVFPVIESFHQEISGTQNQGQAKDQTGSCRQGKQCKQNFF